MEYLRDFLFDYNNFYKIFYGKKYDIFNFIKCWFHDKELTFKLILYVRKTEKRLGRKLFTYIAKHNSEFFIQNMEKIAKHGRWDDFVKIFLDSKDSNLQIHILRFFNKQLRNDEKEIRPSLCAKWVPSEGKKNDFFNKRLRNYMKIDSKQMRNLLTSLRTKIGIIEQKLCKKDIKSIEYSKVLRFAMKKYSTYKGVFNSRDYERFQKYKRSRKHKKINCPSKLLQQRKINEKRWEEIKEDIKENFSNTIIVPEMSIELFKNDHIHKIIALTLLISDLNSNEIIVPCSEPRIIKIEGKNIWNRYKNFRTSIFENVFDLNKIQKLAGDRKIIFLTSQDLKIRNQDFCWKFCNNEYKIEKNKIIGYSDILMKYFLKQKEIDIKQIMLNKLKNY
jgi:hypothetical protein